MKRTEAENNFVDSNQTLLLTEVTPEMIHSSDLSLFKNLSWNPYFSEKLLGEEVTLSGLSANERARILIPPEVIQERIEGINAALAKMIQLHPQQGFAFGSIENGGNWFYTQVVQKLETVLTETEKSRVVNDAHAGIRSYRGTQKAEHEIYAWPDARTINNKVWILLEGVIDSGETLKEIARILRSPENGYQEVDPLVVALVDKIEARHGNGALSIPTWSLLFMYNGWMFGCGPDLRDGLYRVVDDGCVLVREEVENVNGSNT